MKVKASFIVMVASLLFTACVRQVKQKEAVGQPTVPMQVEEVSVDQSAGLQVIEALSRAYGDEPGVPGNFLDKPGCPSYLEGMYFDGAMLVIQVRGDTVQARQELRLAAGSNAFQLEQVRDSLFSQKQLDSLMKQIRHKWDSIPLAVRANISGYGTGLHVLDVWLVVNTPEQRAAFRQYVLDSPALSFSGPTGKEPCDEVGVCDTLGVWLESEFATFPADTEAATFLLHNEGEHTVSSGKHYRIAYERDGRWYWLPINTVAEDIAYITSPGGVHRFTGYLHPQVNHNRPGRYRFFTKVTIGDENVLMMAEFWLAAE